MATETMVGGEGGVEHGQTPTFRGPMQEEEAPKWAWEGNSERQVDSKKPRRRERSPLGNDGQDAKATEGSVGFSNTRSQATMTGKLQGRAGAEVMVGGQGGTWANGGGTNKKAWHEGAEAAKRSLCEDARDSAGVHRWEGPSRERERMQGQMPGAPEQ